MIFIVILIVNLKSAMMLHEARYTNHLLIIQSMSIVHFKNFAGAQRTRRTFKGDVHPP